MYKSVFLLLICDFVDPKLSLGFDLSQGASYIRIYQDFADIRTKVGVRLIFGASYIRKITVYGFLNVVEPSNHWHQQFMLR